MQDEHIVKYLKTIPMFKQLTDAECIDLVRTFAVETVKTGRVVCTEGEPGAAMFIIENGKVRVHKATVAGAEEEVAVLGRSSVFGEMALLDEGPASATVTVLEDAVLYRIDGTGFNVLRANAQSSAFKVIRYLTEVLCARLRATNGKIEQFYANPEESLRLLQQRAEGLHDDKAKSYKPPPVRREYAAPRTELPEDKPVEYAAPQGADPHGALLYFLGRLPLFKGIPAHDLGVMAGVLKERTFPAGAAVFNEGDVGDSLFLVGRGGVSIRKAAGGMESRLLATVMPGGVFGEVSLVDGKRRSASCFTMSESLLFALRKADFDDLFRANNPFAFHLVDRIAGVLSRRLRQADESYIRIFARPEDTVQHLKKRLDEILQSLDGGIPDDKLLRIVKFKPGRQSRSGS